MSYIKRELFIPTNDPVLQDELVILIKSKKDLNLRNDKVLQLVFAPVPMSKIRWSRYLNSAEMNKFLMSVNSDNIANIDDNIGI